MNVSILIPWRTDNGERARLWKHCQRLWDVLPYQIVVGSDSGDGPFNAAQAFNNAASKATGDVFVLYGADHLPDRDRIDWAVQQLETYKWCGLYSHTANMTKTDTNAILAGWHPDAITADRITPFCIAVIAVRADAWIPLDERFIGWGSEDTAWRLTLRDLYGPPPEPHGMLKALYHDPAPMDHAEANYDLLREYQRAYNAARPYP